jgi:hypothetical protein
MWNKDKSLYKQQKYEEIFGVNTTRSENKWLIPCHSLLLGRLCVGIIARRRLLKPSSKIHRYSLPCCPLQFALAFFLFYQRVL